MALRDDLKEVHGYLPTLAQQYKDGKMSSAADALNGKAIDVTKI